MTKKQIRILNGYCEQVKDLEAKINAVRVKFEEEMGDMFACLDTKDLQEELRLIDEASSLFASAEHNLVHVGEFLKEALSL